MTPMKEAFQGILPLVPKRCYLAMGYALDEEGNTYIFAEFDDGYDGFYLREEDSPDGLARLVNALRTFMASYESYDRAI
ncbi:hypothetical protein [Thermus phage P23-45]|uniref:SMI1/KNR4 family protein n=1 Tax=Thermus virus P23-45 TaxID=2914006 RepID=A7XX22_BP234|nr:hypothetical protein P23p4 [Thermus phage P23-45]ABU96837.1 hypothetical protein P23p4 [Thermus phage P23-45]UYB98470.1 hypothetical protein [Thermus phage P23-45]